MGRYLFVIQWLLPGGTETHILTLAKALRADGHDVGVFTAGGVFANRFRQQGVKVYARNSFVSGATRSARADLQKVVQSRHYSIVHAHDSAGFRLLAHTPLSATKVITVHGTYAKPLDVRRVGRVARRVMAVSPAVKAYLVSKCGIPKNRIRLVPNGVSIAVFRPGKDSSLRRQFGISQGDTVIGYAGRFTLRKRRVGIRVCRMLAEYAATHKNVHVLVAGRMSREALGRTLGPRVHVLGVVYNMARFYRNCDAVVGTGRVALEAMACEIPTIAIGEAGFAGRMTESNLAQAWRSNFGDHGTPHPWSAKRLFSDLDDALYPSPNSRASTRHVRKLVMHNFSNHRMVERTRHAYQH